jgi:hypothetical protein
LRHRPRISTHIAHEYVYQILGCGLSQLRHLVPKLLAIVGNARIVIDGVDECSKDDQKSILKELLALCVAEERHSKILLSSRRETHIRKKMESKPDISLDERNEVHWDIETFVRYEMTKVHILDQELRARLESILVEKANGWF